LKIKNYSHLVFFATCFTWCLILLGAYVRLSNAGLGCPDWPGCYGKLVVSQIDLSSITASVEVHKAWKEMVHRYAASFLGFLILLIAFSSLRFRSKEGKRFFLPWILVLWVIFQAFLGKWTVTLKLHPFVVMAHLLGGFTTLSLLTWHFLQTREALFASGPLSYSSSPSSSRTILFINIGFFLLVIQITLGGWVSANYAALACPDFPQCQGHWVPPLDFKSAYGVWHEFGKNYEWGVLHNPARVTLHWMHRLGAMIVFLYSFSLGFYLALREKTSRIVGVILMTLVCLQVLLGISNVFFGLPLPIAVAHNGVAALLLLCFLTLLKTHLARASRACYAGSHS